MAKHLRDRQHGVRLGLDTENVDLDPAEGFHIFRLCFLAEAEEGEENDRRDRDNVPSEEVPVPEVLRNQNLGKLTHAHPVGVNKLPRHPWAHSLVLERDDQHKERHRRGEEHLGDGKRNKTEVAASGETRLVGLEDGLELGAAVDEPAQSDAWERVRARHWYGSHGTYLRTPAHPERE